MGDVNGMASLANMYLKGLGMPANVSMALKLFQKVRDALAQL
jgi:TPR repeat protein